MKEGNLKPGQIFRSKNGNLYFVKKDSLQVYIGHTSEQRVEDNESALSSRPNNDVELVTSIDPEKLWQA